MKFNIKEQRALYYLVLEKEINFRDLIGFCTYDHNSGEALINTCNAIQKLRKKIIDDRLFVCVGRHWTKLNF